jgi:tagaturonate reductase
MTVDPQERIIQIGEGRFLRGFFDWMVAQLSDKGLYDGKVVVVLPRPAKPGTVDIWRQFQGRFTVHIRGEVHGQPVVRSDPVAVVSRLIDPHAEWAAFLGTARNPASMVLVTNTTEAGLVFQEEPYLDDMCPLSIPGKLTRWLYARYQYLGAGEENGIDIVPCELIDRNGDTVRNLVRQCAEYWSLPRSFIDWVQSANRFYNTLVDSIVTSDLGGPLDVAREPYYRWVIEGPNHLGTVLRFEQAGLAVYFVDNLNSYRALKVRVLNGAHTAMAAIGQLAGLETIKDVMDHPVFASYVMHLLYDEVAPTLIGKVLPRPDVNTFIHETLERFRNPYIRHYLRDIQLNAIAKVQSRLLPTLYDVWQDSGAIPPLLTIAIAAVFMGSHSDKIEWDNTRHLLQSLGSHEWLTEPLVVDAVHRHLESLAARGAEDTVRDVLGA